MQKYSKTPSTHSCHPVAVLKLNCDFAEEDCSLICTRRIPSENNIQFKQFIYVSFVSELCMDKVAEDPTETTDDFSHQAMYLASTPTPPTNLRDQCLLNIIFSAVASGSGVRSTRGKKGSSRLRKVQ